eukprot:11668516-Prorocentrum_lima.AAC.1
MSPDEEPRLSQRTRCSLGLSRIRGIGNRRHPGGLPQIGRQGLQGASPLYTVHHVAPFEDRYG